MIAGRGEFLFTGRSKNRESFPTEPRSPSPCLISGGSWNPARVFGMSPNPNRFMRLETINGDYRGYKNIGFPSHAALPYAGLWAKDMVQRHTPQSTQPVTRLLIRIAALAPHTDDDGSAGLALQ